MQEAAELMTGGNRQRQEDDGYTNDDEGEQDRIQVVMKNEKGEAVSGNPDIQVSPLDPERRREESREQEDGERGGTGGSSKTVLFWPNGEPEDDASIVTFLFVRNYAKEQLKGFIEFTKLKRGEEEVDDSEVPVHLPRSRIPVDVKPGCETVVYALHKTRVVDVEETAFSWLDYLTQKIAISVEIPSLPSLELPPEPKQEVHHACEDLQGYDAKSSDSGGYYHDTGAAAAASGEGGFACGACTYWNDYGTICDMCQTPRG